MRIARSFIVTIHKFAGTGRKRDAQSIDRVAHDSHARSGPHLHEPRVQRPHTTTTHSGNNTKFKPSTANSPRHR